MACSIQLVRLNDFAADIDSIDLSSDGYSLDQDGYFPVVAPISAKSVHEVITLKLQGTSKDDLAAMTQDIDEKIKQVQWWIDDPGVERYQVWLRVQQENESLPRQAQLLNITPPDKLRVFVPEEINNNFIGSYSLGIERTPFWEDPYPYPTTTNLNNLDSVGGMGQLIETINGDVPARIAQACAHRAAGIAEAWWGFRTTRFGDPSKFHPVWPLAENSPTLTTGTTITSDATAYSGNRLTCTFTPTATLAARVSTGLYSQTGADYTEHRGIYNVLLRAKVTTGTARVRMLYGFQNNIGLAQPVYRSLVPITSTVWKLHSLGQMSIPPGRTTWYVDLIEFLVQIQAERTIGSGDLHMDCLVLIPYNEGSAALRLDTLEGAFLSVYTMPDGSVFAQSDAGPGLVSATSYGAIPPIVNSNFGVPANNERPYVIMAVQQDDTTGSVLADKVDFEYSYIPRWRTLRGNVT